MSPLIKYTFTAQMWQHQAPGGWYFVSLPKALSKEIRENLQWQEEGWGRMKATAQIGEVSWETAIWFDTKREAYLLPIKADIRKRAKLHTEKAFEWWVWV
jgi:hypothetical protein